MSDRVQIPFSFSFPSGTAYVAASSGGSPTTSVNIQEPVVGTTVTITIRSSGSPATIWQAETGSSTYTSISTDTGGNVPGWLDPGSYKLVASPSGSFTGATINFDAVRGDAVTNIAAGAIAASQLTSACVASSNLVTAVAQALVPTGTIMDFAGSAAPSGYHLCDGSVQSQTGTYAALYAVIGSTYNTGGEGAGNFRLPNTQGRFTLGAGSGVGGYSLPGNTGGSLGHVHGLGTAALTVAIGSPAVTVTLPALTIPNHTHVLNNAGGSEMNLVYSSSSALGWEWGAGCTSQFETTAVSTIDQSSYKAVGTNVTGPALYGNTSGLTSGVSIASEFIFGSVNSGHTSSGNLTSGQNSAAADPAYLTLNKIVKL